jgi:UDP-glucose 6-dehydrogenase
LENNNIIIDKEQSISEKIKIEELLKDEKIKIVLEFLKEKNITISLFDLQKLSELKDEEIKELFNPDKFKLLKENNIIIDIFDLEELVKLDIEKLKELLEDDKIKVMLTFSNNKSGKITFSDFLIAKKSLE